MINEGGTFQHQSSKPVFGVALERPVHSRRARSYGACLQ